MSKKFLIPSLVAAGFFGIPTAASVPRDQESVEDKRGSFFEVSKAKTAARIAAHRSHSSHRSHASHRSSSGGGYAVPRTTPKTATPSPLYNPPSSRNESSTPRTSILPSPPAAASRGGVRNSDAFNQIAKKVQEALRAYGYYNGAIDGIIGSGSKSALARFQADYSLRVTGTITPEVLSAFNIQTN